MSTWKVGGRIVCVVGCDLGKRHETYWCFLLFFCEGHVPAVFERRFCFIDVCFVHGCFPFFSNSLELRRNSRLVIVISSERL